MLFWSEPYFFKRYKHELATSTYLSDCDVVIFCDRSGLFGLPPSADRIRDWLGSFVNGIKIVRGCGQKPIWND